MVLDVCLIHGCSGSVAAKSGTELDSAVQDKVQLTRSTMDTVDSGFVRPDTASGAEVGGTIGGAPPVAERHVPLVELEGGQAAMASMMFADRTMSRGPIVRGNEQTTADFGPIDAEAAGLNASVRASESIVSKPEKVLQRSQLVTAELRRELAGQAAVQQQLDRQRARNEAAVAALEESRLRRSTLMEDLSGMGIVDALNASTAGGGRTTSTVRAPKTTMPTYDGDARKYLAWHKKLTAFFAVQCGATDADWQLADLTEGQKAQAKHLVVLGLSGRATALAAETDGTFDDILVVLRSDYVKNAVELKKSAKRAVKAVKWPYKGGAHVKQGL